VCAGGHDLRTHFVLESSAYWTQTDPDLQKGFCATD
jgi:hypothetical protein